MVFGRIGSWERQAGVVGPQRLSRNDWLCNTDAFTKPSQKFRPSLPSKDRFVYIYDHENSTAIVAMSVDGKTVPMENAMTGASVAKEGEGAPAISKSTKDDWIEVAIDILIKEGIDQVKIQVISKRLGVSRSSFYWFFKDINALQDELLSYWLRRNTGPVIERAMRPSGNLTEAVCSVFECWINPALFDSSLDTVIRFWARKDTKVRSIVEQADNQRVEALTRMFVRHGVEDEEAFIRARVLYFTQVGYFALEVRESLEIRTKHLRNYLLAHIGSEPDEQALEAYIRHVESLKVKPA